ncbi:protein kinase GAF family protein [Nitzschia inconspicua]|uniref:Protein kinase GAF family protein n=1 Tax=Nitzschia inconspicua TaxID=303405 RepID=A0A9K3LY65_9STRA|nr:protein kinase GAF family protein [Nitzschia inconspicua]
MILLSVPMDRRRKLHLLVVKTMKTTTVLQLLMLAISWNNHPWFVASFAPMAVSPSSSDCRSRHLFHHQRQHGMILTVRRKGISSTTREKRQRLLLTGFHPVPSSPYTVITALATQQPQHAHPTTTSSSDAVTVDDVVVGDNIGSGSYGTVHFLKLSDRVIQTSLDNNNNNIFVGKRPWTEDELQERMKNNQDEKNSSRGSSSSSSINTMKKDVKERATRCLYYWQVERHCFNKLSPHPQLPPFYGVVNNEWMVFGFVGTEAKESIFPLPAPTLDDLMRLDVEHPTQLNNIASAFGVDTFEETMDRIIPSLLSVLKHVHHHQIVHRDVKPSNLLVHDSSLLLMDFGSAADLEPSVDRGVTGSSNGIMASLLQRQQQRVGLDTDLNGNRVAVSPIYAAPEIFINVHDAPTAFDIFSAALIICQLLFGYLEERVDAGFHQQLQDGANCDLNVWLNNELGTKLRPVGLDHALEYLGERPGLWTLLSDMLSLKPSDRPTAQQALRQWEDILLEKQNLQSGLGSDDESTLLTYSKPKCKDHPFFCMVLESLETCKIPSSSKPLHYVATFSRAGSLGLVLSEKDEDNNSHSNTNTINDKMWKEATKDALPGEVFIKEIIPGSQADELGIFEVGDRLSGIGELPFIDGGFEKAVEMLQDQPRRAKFVRLHFDRLSVRANKAISMVPTEQVEIQVADTGAWSAKGKRTAQEDAFFLHEIHDVKDRSVLVAGVMDGHGGTAAAQMVARELPSILSNELLVQNRQRPVTDAATEAWTIVCERYRSTCQSGECIADYDPREGVLMAETGSKGLIAGTTCTMFVLDETTSDLTVLNCGDSRSVVIGGDGSVRFATEDHKPQSEEKRIQNGIEMGLDYSLPQCRLSRWWIKVGDYEYSVARSLEGPFATSKGIISDPDVTTLSVQRGEILVSASDGLWDVMDSSEVAIDLHKMRTSERMTARDAARALCNMAIQKGSSDNVSATVVYL